MKNKATLVLNVFCLFGFSQSWNPAPYCTPSVAVPFGVPCSAGWSSNTPGNWNNDIINSFNTVGAVSNISNNNSGCNGLPLNYIYYCNHYLQTNAAQTVSCNLQTGTIYPQGFAIFVDWNQDNVFQVPSERIAATAMWVAANTWTTLVFTVPPAQPNGVYRMRVRCAYSMNGNFIDPCNSVVRGESEDYTVYVGITPPGPSIVTATACPNQTVCLGQNANLSVAYSGTASTTFNWGGPNNFSSTIQNPTVINTTTASNGYYYVSLNTATCPVLVSTHVYIQQTVPPVNATSSSSAICNGGSATLTASGATSYTWNPSSSTNTSIVVSPTSTTIYTVVGTVTNNSCPGIKSYTLTVNLGPSPNISSSNSVICSGGSATLLASNATTYTWNPGSATGASLSVSPTITTVYTVAATATSNACVGISMYTLTVNPCVGLKSVIMNSDFLKIYPNPFKDEIKITSTEVLRIKLTDVNGKEIIKREVEGETIINTSNLAKGVYFIQVISDKGVKPIKLIKD